MPAIANLTPIGTIAASNRTFVPVSQSGSETKFRDTGNGETALTQSVITASGKVSDKGVTFSQAVLNMPDYSVTASDIANGAIPAFAKVEIRVTMPSNYPASQVEDLQTTVMGMVSNSLLADHLFAGSFFY